MQPRSGPHLRMPWSHWDGFCELALGFAAAVFAAVVVGRRLRDVDERERVPPTSEEHSGASNARWRSSVRARLARSGSPGPLQNDFSTIGAPTSSAATSHAISNILTPSPCRDYARSANK